MFRVILLKYLQNNKLNLALYKYNNAQLSKNCNLFAISCLHTTNITYNFKHALKQKNVHNLTEKEYLVKLKDDPDRFGLIDEDPEIDPGDVAEEQFLEEKPAISQKLSTKQYADIIKPLLAKRKVKEAIDVLEIRMLKQDRVKPENYIYNLIIGACGRVGYTKKAFSLYNTMKKRGLKVMPGTYTALFNACANSPWASTDGLTRAKHLRNIMIEQMYEPNCTTYNAMIKAFGRCGDLETAFALVDEMFAKGIAIKDDTLNFLLQACITDTEAGFRHALLVWRKFIEKKIAPSVYTYNLLLRCMRDCGLGDVETTKDVVKRLLPPDKQVLMLESDGTKVIAQSDNQVLDKPNLMAPVPHLGNILSLSEVKRPEDRLLLVGGCSAFLANMVDNECAPDVKTFAQLLDNIPSTLAAEKELIQALRKANVKPDVDFFNMLIKKRSLRFDYDGAKEVLMMIKTARFKPDLVTYGVLALGCKTKDDALSLLKEMEDANYRINIEILGAMLTQACYHNKFPYVMQIMEMCISEDVQPGKKFLDNLEAFKKKSKLISNDTTNPLSKSEFYQKGYKIFKMRYKTWLEQVKLDESESAHPWQQYRQTTDTNVKYYRDKEQKVRFKPVHKSLFRQKTRVQNVKVKK